MGESPESLLARSRLIVEQIHGLNRVEGEFPAYPRIAEPLCGLRRNTRSRARISRCVQFDAARAFLAGVGFPGAIPVEADANNSRQAFGKNRVSARVVS